jgi:hypothetical protein
MKSQEKMSPSGMMLLIALFLITAYPKAQTITATSAPFSFPSGVAVKMQKNVPHAVPYFKYSGMSFRSGLLTFAWSFPTQAWNQKGTIVVYSLLGRAIKAFPVSMNAGTVIWNISKENVRGVYIARITCGSDRQNLKLLLCR